jgi:3-oxoacyl-[acyl-carrier-protein] synthase-3
MLRVSAALFGDGAGAMVLTRGEAGDPGLVVDCQTFSVGSGRAPGILSAIGGIKMPFLYREDCRQAHVMEHDYTAIGRFLPEVANRLFDGFGARLVEQLEAFDVIVPAQANGQIKETLTDVLRERCPDHGVADRTRDKIFVDISDVGNTGAASVYIALDKLRRSGRARKGHKLLLVPAEATKWFYGTIEMIQ